MRILGVIVTILGLAAIVFGILFIPQASSAEKQIADSVAPLQLDQVDGKYDVVSASYDQMKMAVEPTLQAKQPVDANMMDTYNYLSAQRALLGLAKANIGTAKFVRTNGIIDIIAGLGLVLTGIVLLRKSSAD
jgi:hypothetical protein